MAFSDKQKALLAALESSMGIVTTACEKAGISRAMYYKYLKSNARFAEEVKRITEVSLDFAESKLFELINGVQVRDDRGRKTGVYKTPPNVAATIFYLKTKGKHRGYVEQTNVAGADGGPLFNWVDLARSAGEDENLTDLAASDDPPLLLSGVIDANPRDANEDDRTNGHNPS